MKILNTCPQIQRYFQDQEFCLELWRQYAAEISPTLAQKCEEDIRSYCLDTDVLPVIGRALSNFDQINQTGAVFDRIMHEFTARLPCLFEEDPNIALILYLGLCNGAGWSTVLDGQNCVLLGVEKIIELNWGSIDEMRGLIFHEIGHLWHKTVGKMAPAGSGPRWKSLLQLYQEGVAMVCEQILLADSEAYHQNKGDWLSWCADHEASLKKEYLARLEKGESTQDFFGDWNQYQGHSDVGYYLGCQFVKYLQRKFSLRELANLPYSILDREFISFART